MTTFEALGIEEGLLHSISALGFTQPTPIQEKAIPVLLQGTKDFIGLAQTGTGKTAAFGFPLLQLINKDDRFPQALIVCPTRELCLQITNDLNTFKSKKEPLLLKQLRLCDSTLQWSEDENRPSCTPNFFRVFPLKKGLDLSQGCMGRREWHPVPALRRDDQGDPRGV